MAHYGTLRDVRFASDVDDIRGTDVYGMEDEILGTIDDVIFDHASGKLQYVIVDSGGWLSSRKFMVPADCIMERAEHDDDFFINMSHEQIEQLPAYDDKIVEDKDRFRDYESRLNQRDTIAGQFDITNDLHRPYPIQQGRSKRFEAFEKHLRRNRADITSECHSCAVERNKAA